MHLLVLCILFRKFYYVKQVAPERQIVIPIYFSIANSLH